MIAPVQEVATRAVEPFRDAWGWASSLKDARDRAASLETEVDRLRGEVVFSDVQAQRLDELEKLLGVEKLVDASKDLGGYEARTSSVVTRSISPWWRSARVGIGSSDGVMRNSPVLAGSEQGAALVGIVTNVSSALGGRLVHHRRPHRGRRRGSPTRAPTSACSRPSRRASSSSRASRRRPRSRPARPS